MGHKEHNTKDSSFHQTPVALSFVLVFLKETRQPKKMSKKKTKVAKKPKPSSKQKAKHHEAKRKGSQKTTRKVFNSVGLPTQRRLVNPCVCVFCSRRLDCEKKMKKNKTFKKMAISPDFYVSALFKLKRIQILSPAQRRGGIAFFCFFLQRPLSHPYF